jgi:hypothetical protein
MSRAHFVLLGSLLWTAAALAEVAWPDSQQISIRLALDRRDAVLEKQRVRQARIVADQMEVVAIAQGRTHLGLYAAPDGFGGFHLGAQCKRASTFRLSPAASHSAGSLVARSLAWPCMTLATRFG